MVLSLPFPGLWAKNFFYKKFSILTYFDHFWLILTNFYPFWPILTNFDLIWLIWPMLTNFDQFWPILTNFDVFWHNWALVNSMKASQPLQDPACLTTIVHNFSIQLFCEIFVQTLITTFVYSCWSQLIFTTVVYSCSSNLLFAAKLNLTNPILFSLGPKLNTKLALHTTHHHHSQTFRPLPGILRGWDLVCWLNLQI